MKDEPNGEAQTDSDEFNFGPSTALCVVDQAVSARFKGTEWELHLVDRRPWRFRARKTDPADHVHQWSLPLDELGGRTACTRCGHIPTSQERRERFFLQKAAEREAQRAAAQRAGRGRRVRAALRAAKRSGL